MIHLDLKREPHWLNLGHGVRVHVRPCTTALMMAARAEAQRTSLPSQNETQATGERTAALVKALGRLGIQEWNGVGDADGEPVPVTPEGVDALLDLWPMADAFERLYLGPALLLDAEKKRIRARAEWHFGGGPGYCRTCATLNRPCANGNAGIDGQRCPYVEHEPLTEAGWQAWDVLTRCAGQLRFAPNGVAVLGLDLGAALSLGSAVGYGLAALAELLPAAEAGAVAAINRHLSESTP